MKQLINKQTTEDLLKVIAELQKDLEKLQKDSEQLKDLNKHLTIRKNLMQMVLNWDEKTPLSQRIMETLKYMLVLISIGVGLLTGYNLLTGHYLIDLMLKRIGKVLKGESIKQVITASTEQLVTAHELTRVQELLEIMKKNGEINTSVYKHLQDAEITLQNQLNKAVELVQKMDQESIVDETKIPPIDF